MYTIWPMPQYSKGPIETPKDDVTIFLNKSASRSGPVISRAALGRIFFLLWML